MENNKFAHLDETQIGNSLYLNVKLVINQAKQSLAIAVNHTLVLSYWHIGKIINDSILQNKRATYGKAVVENLAKRLTLEYGDGFGKSNLTRMMSFNSKFADYQIVATLSQQFSWSHFVEFIKLEDDLKREFYITMCSNEKWSVRTLRERIASMLFERTAIAKKPDEVIKNDLALLIQEHKMTPELFLKDSYLLDFLNLPANFSEKDLEQAILLELEKFILEFGSDFAFISRQKRFQVGGDDFKLDLLFYHRKLKRLILIELKLDKFTPAHKGQVEFYLKWLSKYEKQPGEEEPLAIILCATKNQEVVEILDIADSGIHVAEYWLKLPPKEVLQEKLHTAIINAKTKIDALEATGQ